ncbi:hypothetical protein CC85DRAFT_327288 [Cutaneotrichosporon oleaginosum]|uniref:Uncharacterized protein n=1 Tax=Cutaneotrichosporon oleaginosum TaxID=879819 RepID=A0A0J0XR67_9TREE|nr:uncharacterized protein CC85DRAFT_327288 [Cutaneotrichosporon oleaginosum]KLT43562.1 hypothetical protein CC85DRAFT_327288 [Cutaneotrichosporon oleaginosum]TXT05539.1 hypothetical protein COLE_06859 [Cutaneotrichosporon oleaginosum]
MHIQDGPDRRPATPSSVLPPAFQRSGNGQPASPIRFATSSNAFGLSSSTSHSHSHSLSQTSTASVSTSPLGTTHLPPQALSPASSTTSPPSAGTVQTRRLRRPSLLSLASAAADQAHHNPTLSPTHTLSAVNERDVEEPGTLQPLPRWGAGTAFPSLNTPERVSSAPPIPFEGLTTSASPAPEDTSRWLPSRLQARRSSGSAIADPDEMPPTPLRPFNARLQGRPLPGPLLATLISESSPLEHEMRSEARLQRLLSSHPSSMTLTPRQRRTMRMSRGRFPEMVGDDDDDDDMPSGLGSRWRAGSSDSDSDDMMEEDWPPPNQTPAQGAGAVNSAFASVMDLDRPSSGGSSAFQSNSGKSTPGGVRNGNGATGKPRVGAPSPGTGLLLPTAFGGLGMGTAGSATPLGSPTAEKADLMPSPSASAVASPGMMQYRDPPTSIRTGKRKAGAEERFDPYKRPRGSSPSPFQTAVMSPSKPMAIPIPSSPSHAPVLSSTLALSSPGYLNLASARPHKPAHPYTRPMSSRSRAASPALSIGSTSGVLSTSLGNNGLTKDGKPLAGPFIPSGPGAKEAVSAAFEAGAAPGQLGSMGMLSLRGQQISYDSDRTNDSDRMEED